MILGRLEGIGAMVADSERYEPVAYDIEVAKDGQFTTGVGTIHVPSFDAGMAATEGKVVILHLEGQKTVTIVLQTYDPPSGYAGIVVSGPIPGF